MKSPPTKAGPETSAPFAARRGRSHPDGAGLHDLQALADRSPAVQRIAALAEESPAQRMEDEETLQGKPEGEIGLSRRAAPPAAGGGDAPTQRVAASSNGAVVQLALPSNVNDMVARVEAGKGSLGSKGKGGQPSYEAGGKTYQGGRTFGNREKKLPKGVTYQEWDVHPLTKGSRGGERLITGSDGSVWYTADHYGSFEKVK